MRSSALRTVMATMAALIAGCSPFRKHLTETPRNVVTNDRREPWPRARAVHPAAAPREPAPHVEPAVSRRGTRAAPTMPYVDPVDIAWRWLVSGVVAIGVGLAVWWTAFVLVPVGVVLLVIGMTKSVRSTLRARSR